MLAMTVKNLVFGNVQRQFWQFKYLMAEGWRGIGHDVAAAFGATGGWRTGNHLVRGLELA